MYETVKNCYIKGMIDIETGLANAIKFGWIDEKQKQEIIDSKKLSNEVV